MEAMKVVIAPQEFKESLRGIEIARAMRDGVCCGSGTMPRLN